MTAPTVTPTLRRRPIRGALYGLVAGLGVALILIDRAIIALGTLTPIVCILVGGVLGLAWAWFGPARDAGPPPSPREPEAEEPTTEAPATEAPTAEAPTAEASEADDHGVFDLDDATGDDGT